MVNYELSSDNIKEVDWSASQEKEWLNNLKNKLNWNNGFFDYIGEIRNNFKKLVSDIFSTKKESSLKLDNLKEDISNNNEKEWDKTNETTTKTDNKNVDKKLDSAEKDTKSLKEKLKEICVRSRKYGDVNKNDCWFVSFWKLQFHGDKSKKIMHNIKSVDSSRFNSIMTDSLFKDIDKACKSKRNDTQAKQFKKLMEDSKAQKEMDKVVDETIEWYIEKIKSWWVTDARAILAFWRICNYWSWYAQTIQKKMAENKADFNDYKQVIEWFEKSEKSKWKTTTSQKFKKKSSYFGNKSLEEVIGEYITTEVSTGTSIESQEKEPEDNKIVSVKDYIKDIKLDMRYATTNNFTWQKIYEDADAKLRYWTIKKLKVAQDELMGKWYSIKIWDAYRPQSAQKKLRSVRPDPTLVARPEKWSAHTRWNTVDITLVKSDWTEIPMPSEFDDNNKKKVDRNYSDLTPEQRNNAKMLEDAMKKAWFNWYDKEWWHYSDTTNYPMERWD